MTNGLPKSHEYDYGKTSISIVAKITPHESSDHIHVYTWCTYKVIYTYTLEFQSYTVDKYS